MIFCVTLSDRLTPHYDWCRMIKSASSRAVTCSTVFIYFPNDSGAARLGCVVKPKLIYLPLNPPLFKLFYGIVRKSSSQWLQADLWIGRQSVVSCTVTCVSQTYFRRIITFVVCNVNCFGAWTAHQCGCFVSCSVLTGQRGLWHRFSTAASTVLLSVEALSCSSSSSELKRCDRFVAFFFSFSNISSHPDILLFDFVGALIIIVFHTMQEENHNLL